MITRFACSKSVRSGAAAMSKKGAAAANSEGGGAAAADSGGAAAADSPDAGTAAAKRRGTGTAAAKRRGAGTAAAKRRGGGAAAADGGGGAGDAVDDNPPAHWSQHLQVTAKLARSKHAEFQQMVVEQGIESKAAMCRARQALAYLDICTQLHKGCKVTSPYLAPVAEIRSDLMLLLATPAPGSDEAHEPPPSAASASVSAEQSAPNSRDAILLSAPATGFQEVDKGPLSAPYSTLEKWTTACSQNTSAVVISTVLMQRFHLLRQLQRTVNHNELHRLIVTCNLRVSPDALNALRLVQLHVLGHADPEEAAAGLLPVPMQEDLGIVAEFGEMNGERIIPTELDSLEKTLEFFKSPGKEQLDQVLQQSIKDIDKMENPVTTLALLPAAVSQSAKKPIARGLVDNMSNEASASAALQMGLLLWSHHVLWPEVSEQHIESGEREFCRSPSAHSLCSMLRLPLQMQADLFKLGRAHVLVWLGYLPASIHSVDLCSFILRLLSRCTKLSVQRLKSVMHQFAHKFKAELASSSFDSNGDAFREGDKLDAMKLELFWLTAVSPQLAQISRSKQPAMAAEKVQELIKAAKANYAAAQASDSLPEDVTSCSHECTGWLSRFILKGSEVS
jgi:hypothetical protein